MATLNFSTSDIEPLAPMGTLPAGRYRAMCVASDVKPTASGNGSYLQLEWQVLEAQYANRKLWSRLNIDNPSEKAVEIARRELASICHAVGHPAGVSESEELHNVPVDLEVGIEKRADGGEQNRIRGYIAIGGVAQAAASKPAAAKPAATATPWKK